MKLSILTPSYNQGEFIEQNILSVLNQNYPDFEHIIIDGGSADNTLTVLKKYPHLKWVSEKDNGQSDALNKGLALATGEIIGWLNTDDYYIENIFSDVIHRFKDNAIGWIIGRIKSIYEGTGFELISNYQPISSKSLRKNCDNMRTPAAFYRKLLLEKTGGFNEQFHMVMDYDLYVRLSKISEPLNVNKIYTVFRHHPLQKTTFKNQKIQLKELNTIFYREQYYLAMITKRSKLLKTFLKRIIKNILFKLKLLPVKYLNIPVFSFKNRNKL